MRTDYLVVGAGTSGLSFVDSLLDADPTADVVLVDRRPGPERALAGGLPVPAAAPAVSAIRGGVDEARLWQGPDPRDRGGPVRAGEWRGGVRLRGCQSPCVGTTETGASNSGHPAWAQRGAPRDGLRPLYVNRTY